MEVSHEPWTAAQVMNFGSNLKNSLFPLKDILFFLYPTISMAGDKITVETVINKSCGKYESPSVALIFSLIVVRIMFV